MRRKLCVLGTVLLLKLSPVLAESVPENFVDLTAFVPGVIIDARYAGDENFIGRPVAGYHANKAFLSREAAEALREVQLALAPHGLTLKVFDAYRPQRAVDDFMKWVKDARDTTNKATYFPDVAKDHLVPDGYIAEKSGHSRGATLDLTIASVGPDGSVVELDMGSPWDFFGPVSHALSDKVPAQARANRALLRTVMLQHGFKPYEEEWWHFTLADEPYPETYFDFPVE